MRNYIAKHENHFFKNFGANKAINPVLGIFSWASRVQSTHQTPVFGKKKLRAVDILLFSDIRNILNHSTKFRP